MQWNGIATIGELISFCMLYTRDTKPDLFPLIDGAPSVVKPANILSGNFKILNISRKLEIHPRLLYHVMQ